jgi:leader peptidase (prepilin peptidase)/N-methyltransferase
MQPHVLFYASAFILGTMIGSFANVCIYRLPRGRSLLFPGSHCSFCQQPIQPWHNIPLLSYVWLGGRCAYCQSTISWRYPLVEFACGLLYVLMYHAFGLSVQGAIAVFLATALLIVTFIDLDHKIIPDAITLPGIVAGVLASWLLTPVGLGNALFGMVLGGGLCLLIAILSRGGMGGGDIKLVAMIGAFLGWRGVSVTMFLGACAGALVGIGLMLLKKKGRRDPLPFGPFLALGALLALLWEPELIQWYLGIAS